MFEWFRKRDHDAELKPAGTRLTVRGGQKLLDAALEAGLDWPHDCRVGSCGTCRCVLSEGRVKPLTDFVYTLPPEDIAAGAILACQSLLKSDVVVEIELGEGRAAVTHTAGRIASLQPLTHDILELRVALENGTLDGALAGQYADVRAPGIDAPRSYSFARAPAAEAAGQLTFFVRHVPGGEFTDWLFADDRTGETLEVSGPYGTFHQRPGEGRMICVAGGSGLAPVHALVEDAALNGIERDCVVLFGARTRNDLYYQDALEALGQRWRGAFELVPVLSEEPADSDWDGARGLVTDALAAVAGEAGFGAGDQGYLCGPPAMVDAGVERLVELGVDREAVFFDRFLDASTQPGGRAGIAS